MVEYVKTNFDIQRIIGLRLPFIFKHMLEDPDLLTLPQHLIVSNMTVSFNFCEVLLSFLVKNMEIMFKKIMLQKDLVREVLRLDEIFHLKITISWETGWGDNFRQKPLEKGKTTTNLKKNETIL